MRLDNTSKLQIVQERRLLAEAGHISYADLLPVLDKLAKEESYLVVSAVSQVISALERFIDEGTEAEKAFNSLVAKLARHNYDRLGFEAKDGESDEDELVRQLAVSMMIRSMMQKLVKLLAKSSQLTRRILQDFQQLFAHKF